MYFIFLGDVLIVLKRRLPASSHIRGTCSIAQCILQAGNQGRWPVPRRLFGHKRVTGWVTFPKSGPPSAFKLHDFDSLQRKKTDQSSTLTRPDSTPSPTKPSANFFLPTSPAQRANSEIPPSTPIFGPCIFPSSRAPTHHHNDHALAAPFELCLRRRRPESRPPSQWTRRIRAWIGKR